MYFQIFQGVNRLWFWRLCSKEQEKIAFSSQGYANKEDVLNKIRILQSHVAGSQVEEVL